MMRQFVKLSALLAMLLALPILAHANGLPVFTELAASAGKSVVFISTEKNSNRRTTWAVPPASTAGPSVQGLL